MTIIKILLFVLVLAGSTQCQWTNVWHGITPLASTRSDVEKLIGKPVGPGGDRYLGVFRVDDAQVYVFYSTGRCSEKSNNGWDVPELTVVRMWVSPDNPNLHKLDDLNIDPARFKRERDHGSLNLVYYTNSVAGVTLTVDTGDGPVIRYIYYPNAKDKHLECKKQDF